MSEGYNYERQKKELFTDEGQRMFLKIRDRVHALLKKAGAFRQQEAISGSGGDSWTMIACIDRLVELGEIEEIPRECWTQYKVYASPQRHNR